MDDSKLTEELQRLRKENASLHAERDAAGGREEKARLFDLLIQNSFDAVYVLNGRRYEYVNPRFCEITGYDYDEVISPEFDFNVLLPRKSKEIIESRYRARQSGERIPGSYEIRILHKNGGLVDLEVTTTSIGGAEEGEVRVMGVMRDASERKRAERARYASEKLLTRFIEHVPAAVAIFDRELRLLRASKRWVDEHPTPGDGDEGLFAIVSDVPPRWREIVSRALEGEGFSGDEEAVARADGSTDWYRFDCHPWVTAEGGVGGVVVFLERVTERVEHRRELVESRAQLESALDAATYPILIADAERHAVEYGNASAREYFGGAKELREKILGDLFVDSIRRSEFLAAFGARGEVSDLETRLRDRSGKVFWAIVSVRRLEFGDDEKLVVSINDVDERRSFEEALRRGERRFREMIEIAVEGVCNFNDKCEITFVNPEFARLFGFDPLELIGNNVCDLTSERVRDDLGEKPNPLGEGIDRLEVVVTRTDGAELNAVFSTRVLRDAEENIVGGMAMAFDLTERKEREKQMLSLTRAMEQSPASIMTLDKDEAITYVNPKFCEITGYTPEEVMGRNPRMFAAEGMPDGVDEGFIAAAAQGEVWSGEFPNRRKNGEIFWHDVSVSPVMERGKPTSYVVIGEDVTERKRVERELLEAKERAEESDRLKSSLLANLSHEIRTPMNGVIGLSSHLEEALEDDVEKEYAKKIRVSGQRLMNTLHAILEYAHLESRPVDYEPTPVRVSKIVENVAETFRPVAEQNDLKLETTIEDDASAEGTPAMIARVLENLVDNAIKYTIDGGVNVVVRRTDDRVEIAVRDTGVGIDPDKLDVVFEEFRQASEGLGRHFEGSGLGLAIAKRLVEKMNGEIRVAGEVGVGSVFTVSLPVADDAPTAEEIGAKRDRPSSEFSALIVEDNRTNVEVAKIFLGSANCRIEVAHTGEEATRLAGERRFDVVLMDVNLGAGINGVEATKRIRKIPLNAETPVIAVTGYALDGDRRDFLDEGFASFLPKPYSREELLDAIYDALK